jgi:cysteine synthase A
MVCDNILDCVGRTPCLRLKFDEGTVFAKAEFMNPGGSVKDRIIFRILGLAEKEGRLRPGMGVAEATSGNTGISLAIAGAARGYPVTIFMPETASRERRKLLLLLGANMVLTPAQESVGGAVAALEKFVRREPDTFVMNQFTNQENVAAHYHGTGREIWEDMEGDVDCFINGIGSGGTLMGVGSFLKERTTAMHLLAVEPRGAAVLLGHTAKVHSIEGIGDGFLPEIVDPELIDSVMEISNKDAVERATDLARTKGLLVGISAGANLAAAIVMLKKNPGWRIATVLPDRAERYFSTPLFEGAA